MPQEKQRASRKTKSEKRYKLRLDSYGNQELECPSCEKYLPIKDWWVHNCTNPIVKRDEHVGLQSGEDETD